MENFNERKRAYFERLRDNKYILEALKAKEDNSVETLAMIIDPQDETELEIANGMITFFGDTLNMIMEQYERDYEEKEMSEIPIIDYFIRTITALRNGDKEALEAIKQEISKTPSAESIADMFYDLMSIMMYDAEAMSVYVFEKSGFDYDDDLSELQFQLYFKKANEFINSCMPSMQTQKAEDLKNPETVMFFKKFVDRFHSLYQRDYDNKNNLGK